MILFNPIIQILTLADFDRLQPAPRTILQAICGVTGSDSRVVGLATINNDAAWPAQPIQRLCEEPFGRLQATLLAVPEFDRVAVTVECAVEVHALAADLDVSLVDMPSAGHVPLPSVETLQQ